MPKVRTQADRRQSAVVTDRHGRKFWTVIEKDTMRSCSALIPKGWTPPLLYGKTPFVPPEAYITYAADDPFEMIIDYDTWITDNDREQESYTQRISAAAIMQFGSGAAAAVRDKSPELMAYVGRPPMPTAPIRAAQKGNLYALGLSDKMPPWAVEYFTAPIKVEDVFENVEDYPDDDIVMTEQPIVPAEFPNVEEPSDVLLFDEDLEAALTLEEQHDPLATGGTSVDPRAAARHVPLEKPTTKRKK